MAELTMNLKIELEKSNHAFQRWNGDYSNWLVKQQQEYDRAMEEIDCTIQALQTTAQQLEESRSLNESIKQQQRREIDQALQQHEGYKRQLLAMEEQLQHYRDEETQAHQRLEKVRADHDSLRQKVEHNLHDLTHGLQHYSKLGLEFQKADGDSMRFIFTQIDQLNPLRPFSFTMFVDQNNTYQLVDTSPVLPSATVASLVSKLNDSNDIGAFVYNMRCLFVKSI